jgi:DNA-binding CsgD family transcriptional regulator
MRGAALLFWVMPILIFLGTAVLATAFFMRYRKEVRHAFLTVLAAALYFLVYVLMVYATTLPSAVAGLSLMTGSVLLAVYAILAWDVPLSFSYALNAPITKRGRALAAAAAAAPLCALVAAIVAALSSPPGREASARSMLAAIDCAAAAPAAAIGWAAAVAAASARKATGKAKAARIAFAASAATFLPAAFALRYLVFPSSYPQREVAVATVLVAWDIVATAIAAGFGPGEAEEGPFVSVPDAFLSEAGITAREAEALELLASGASYKDISATLGLSLPAVKKRLSSVYRKSGAANRVELVNILLEYGGGKRPRGDE